MKKTFIVPALSTATLLPVCLFFLTVPVLAAPGDLDTSFNGTGTATTNFGGDDDFGSGVAVQNDGKIVVAECGKLQQLAKADTVPQGLNVFDCGQLRAEYEKQLHKIVAADGGHQAGNPRQQWQTKFDGRGFLVEPDGTRWKWGLELQSYGFPGHERVVTNRPRVSAECQCVTYTWDEIMQEWFVNDKHGLEHGFTLQSRPPFAGEEANLHLNMTVRGDLRPTVESDGRSVRFMDAQGALVLTYAELHVVDADGHPLPAWFEPVAEGLRVAIAERGARYPLIIDPIAQQAYLKASNNGAGDDFGSSVAMSGDTIVVGAPFEDSAGAAYIFVRSGTTWVQQARLTASNAGAGDRFGISVAISGDTVVIGADEEDSNATGVNGNQTDNSASFAGAAYVFVRSGSVWTQQAYLKASNTEASDQFGWSVAVSGDTAVIGAIGEKSNATGVNGDQANNSAGYSGAAYVFVRSGETWTQQAYLKASNTGADDQFATVAVSGDTVAVGARFEGSNATGDQRRSR